VRNLEAAGVISGYSAQLDRTAVGCSYEPIVWVTLSTVTRESMLAFESAIADVREIIEAARMMGQPDYQLRIATASADSIEALYIDRLANLPHVQTLTSQLPMKIVKRTTQLPIATR
jgi:DNA-binding Lrp family transcriptional regulator